MKKKIIKKNKDAKLKKKRGSFLQTTAGVVTFTILIGAAISALAYYALIRPQLDKVGVGREFDVATATNNLRSETSFFEQLKTLRTNFESIDRKDIEVLAQMLPTNISTPELFAQLEIIARQNGVAIKRINISEIEETAATARQRLQAEVQAGQVKRAKEVVEVLVQVEVTAFDYKSFKKFIIALQDHRRILDVENMFYQSDQDDQRLTLKTYYLKP